MTRTTLLSALLTTVLTAVPIAALAQTADDLKNDEKTPGNVLVYGMGYSGNRYSPLTQITKDNVGKLVPVWSYSLADLQGGEGFPIVDNGVVYVTTHDSTAAVDAITGKQIWRVKHEYPPDTLRVVCCGIVNRGAAIYQGMIIRALMDDRIVALDAKTGNQVWEAKSPDPAVPANGYAMTGAPLIVKGVVIVGVAGAEFSNRGFIEGYDAATGKHLWRTYTIPAKGEPGSETWPGNSELTGGGSSWVTGTYDPDLDLVFWGVGNPAPWNPARAARRQSLHRFDLGDAPGDRRTRLVLPGNAERSVRLRRGADADQRHHQGRRQADQGGDAGQPQRLPLRGGRQDRQAPRSQHIRQGELGERGRHGNGPAGRDRRVQRGAGRR